VVGLYTDGHRIKPCLGQHFLSLAIVIMYYCCVIWSIIISFLGTTYYLHTASI